MSKAVTLLIFLFICKLNHEIYEFKIPYEN